MGALVTPPFTGHQGKRRPDARAPPVFPLPGTERSERRGVLHLRCAAHWVDQVTTARLTHALCSLPFLPRLQMLRGLKYIHSGARSYGPIWPARRLASAHRMFPLQLSPSLPNSAPPLNPPSEHLPPRPEAEEYPREQRLQAQDLRLRPRPPRLLRPAHDGLLDGLRCHTLVPGPGALRLLLHEVHEDDRHLVHRLHLR